MSSEQAATTKTTSALRGVFPAALTMFTADGELDEEATARHVEHLIACGVDGIVAAGSSGEFVAMTEAEHERVIEIAVAAAAGRVPVVASSGRYSTRLSIALTQKAEAVGADAALLTLPYYQKPPKASVVEHFRCIRRHTSLPLLVYNNAIFSGCAELTPRDLTSLWQEGVVCGVKSTTQSVVPVHDLLHLTDASFRVFYGSFQSPMEALLGGAHGWISGFLNFLTRECVELYGACASGDVAKARHIWNDVLLPFKQLHAHGLLGDVNDLAIYRAGLDLMGLHGGFSRQPFEPLDAAQREKLAVQMRDAGLLA